MKLRVQANAVNRAKSKPSRWPSPGSGDLRHRSASVIRPSLLFHGLEQVQVHQAPGERVFNQLRGLVDAEFLHHALTMLFHGPSLEL